MTTPKIERRTITVTELRMDEKDGRRRLHGHAAVFNQLSEDLGDFRELIAPGAFAATIAEDDVRCLFNHDSSMVLGRTRSGTLRLAEDERGLAMAVDLPDTQLARDLALLVERGDVTQQSFGFRTVSDEWHMQEGEAIRTLRAVKLYDVGPVTFAAYPQTDVAARSLEAWRAETEPAVPWSVSAARRRLDMLDRL